MKSRSFRPKGESDLQSWGSSFTEPGQTCGRDWRTKECVSRPRQGRLGPIAHVGDALEVGPSFVQTCLEVVAKPELARGRRSRQEKASFQMPR